MSLHPALCARLIGVIDLQNGVAVRGVGGDRGRYRAVKSFQFPDGRQAEIGGSPVKLIDCYQAVGVQSIYIADLDGIERADVCRPMIDRCLEHAQSMSHVLIDLGIGHPSGETDWVWLKSLMSRHRGLQLIVASECIGSRDALASTVQQLGLRRVAVSCDYKDSFWLSRSVSEQAWYETCSELDVRSAIGIDLSAVGGSSIERTLELCRRIRQRMPDVRYYTGGGVRTIEDAERVFDAGADGLLVASWFVS